jgi:hypothetical protein
MVKKSPQDGNEKRNDAYRKTMLGPYLGTRVVSHDQITQALASGLSVRECHDRLQDAEVLLFETYDHSAREQGWKAACDAIAGLSTSANVDELGLVGLQELADEKRRGFRRGCYASSLTTGTPELDVVIYSDIIGQGDCCKVGRLFVVNEGNDWAEIASVLRSTTDLKEWREQATKQRVDDFLNSRGRLNGLLNVLRILQARKGGK